MQCSKIQPIILKIMHVHKIELCMFIKWSYAQELTLFLEHTNIF